jgi:DNA-binding NarL/FixJ family response regulator
MAALDMENEPGKRVVLVDDSSMVRERLVGLISELPGVTIVGQAAGAAEAIAEIRRLRPDVVVLDISIPGGNGLQVLATIKAETPAPTVIMLTNFAHEQYRRRCFELKADYFFDKSREFEKVLDVLQEITEALPTTGR